MQKLYEESNIQAIADAIRSKNGSEDLYKTSEMAAAIEALEGKDPDCNGMHVPKEALVITGDCQYRFTNGAWNWFIEQYGDRITTKDITSISNMFQGANTLEEIPFDINIKEGGCHSSLYSFAQCYKLKSIGKIVNYNPQNASNVFNGCNNLRCLPEFVNPNWDYAHSYSSFMCPRWFNDCHSLRVIPEELLKELYTQGTSTTYSQFTYMFSNCYALDEIRGVSPQSGTLTSNMFNNTFANCARVKDIIFDMQEDGTPYVVNWKNQLITLSGGVGVNVNYDSNIVDYNSGITADKKVSDDASYQALKNDADWFTGLWEYSRYNHDSAVNTINSLPDASAYLATAGGTNTIKFKGEVGSKTDGGAINTLTEEEIAVAAAKGWTVSMV